MQDPAVSQLVNVLLEDQRTRRSGPLERFLATLATDAGKKSFEAWSQDPVTRLFAGALRSMSETCPHGYPDTDRGLALAHGCMSGISLAERLISDPTRVFPTIFDGAQNLMNRKPADNIEVDYAVPPEGPVKKE